MKTFTLTHARDGNVHTVLFSAPDFETAAREVLAMKEERGIRPMEVKEWVPHTWADRIAIGVGIFGLLAMGMLPQIRRGLAESTWWFLFPLLLPIVIVAFFAVVGFRNASKVKSTSLAESLNAKPMRFGIPEKWRGVFTALVLFSAIVQLVLGVRFLAAATEEQVSVLERFSLAGFACFVLVMSGVNLQRTPKQE